MRALLVALALLVSSSAFADKMSPGDLAKLHQQDVTIAGGPAQTAGYDAQIARVTAQKVLGQANVAKAVTDHAALLASYGCPDGSHVADDGTLTGCTAHAVKPAMMKSLKPPLKK